MHVIAKPIFTDAARKYPDHRNAIMSVYRILDKGDFSTPEDLKQVLPSLDNFKYVDKWWVIDIAGNNLRLIACIIFRANMVYAKHILSHADYDKLTRKYAGGT